MEPLLVELAVSAATTAVGIAVGWAMGGVRGAARERRAQQAAERTERDQMRSILRTLLYCRLADMHRRYVVQGTPCTPADKQEAQEVYQEYHDVLGGNGSGTALYSEIMQAHVA